MAADTTRHRLIGHFPSRLATQLLTQHAAAQQRQLLHDQAAAARAATCARLRDVVPARLLDAPWPADVHDVRLTGIGPSHARGRVRVTGGDSVDLDLHGLTARVAEALLRTLAEHAGPIPPTPACP